MSNVSRPMSNVDVPSNVVELGGVVSERASTPRGAATGLLGRALARWKKGAHAIGVVQTRVIMFFIYLIAVLPLGIIFRMRRDPLQLRRPDGGNWTPCRQEQSTLERARQQF